MAKQLYDYWFVQFDFPNEEGKPYKSSGGAMVWNDKPEVNIMPKPKWNLNTIYISERLQESLRPISRCALTTMVAPMGYGKTTAVNWYLEQRAKAEALNVIRISVYSDNLEIFWKSIQNAFVRAGFDFLRDYTCPTDAAGGGLLADDLCHELAGETACYIFI